MSRYQSIIFRRSIVILGLLQFMSTSRGETASGDTSYVVGQTPEKILKTRLDLHWQLGERESGFSLVPGPYRSYESLYLEIRRDNDLTIWTENELALYRDLAINSLDPDFFLLEFTQYPLAWLSAGIRNNSPALYDKFTVSKDINLIRAFGGGYQEPWSVSLFVGHLATFWSLDDDYNMVAAATGAAGIVASWGSHQIIDNLLMDEDWMRVEWKIKGEGRQGVKSNSWDIKIGYRWNGDIGYSNQFSINYFRERLDKSANDWSLIQNSNFNFSLQIPAEESAHKISRLMLSYGKLIPIRNRLVGINLSAALEYLPVYDEESGEFSSELVRSTGIYFQPMVIF